MNTEEKKKALIADSFQKHYLHFGYKKTTLDEIATDCTISKKTIYQCFKSKEEIYYFIVSRNAQRYCMAMEKIIAGENGISDKITVLIDMIFTENRKWIERGNNAFDFTNKYEIAIEAFRNAYQQLLKKIINDSMSQKEIPEQDIDSLLMFITGILTESAKRFNADPDSVQAMEVSRAIIKLLK